MAALMSDRRLSGKVVNGLASHGEGLGSSHMAVEMGT